MRLRGVLIHEVFRKVLYLTPSERAKFSSGRIYSHVTSDVETLQQLSWSGLGIISSPLRIIGAAQPREHNFHGCFSLLCQSIYVLVCGGT